MSNCPRCHQPVKAQAIACPHCHATLKAYGHPGVTLYQTTCDEALCDTCTYHQDDTCTFPQRPHAQSCTLYHDYRQQNQPVNTYKPSLRSVLGGWLKQNGTWVALVGLIVVSILIALRR